jgi:hypothetical protein
MPKEMKKITAYLVISLMALTTLPFLLFGQTNNQLPETSIISDSLSGNASVGYAGSYKYVNAKVMHSFIRFFKDTSDAFWTLHKTYYSVQFTTGRRKAVAVFGLKGYLYYTIFYGTEKDLPFIEKNIIRNAYPDFKIEGVQEVNNRFQTIWLATLKNCSSIRKVKIAEGQLFEFENWTIHQDN